MAIGADPDAIQEHVLSCDKDLPREQQTVIKFRTLPYEVVIAVQDKMVEAGVQKGSDTTRLSIFSGTQESLILMEGIVDVVNFWDASGKPLMWPPFDPRAAKMMTRAFDVDRVAKMRLLTAMKPAWRHEVAQAISNEQEVTPADAKKSDSPAGSPEPGTRTVETTATASAA